MGAEGLIRLIRPLTTHPQPLTSSSTTLHTPTYSTLAIPSSCCTFITPDMSVLEPLLSLGLKCCSLDIYVVHLLTVFVQMPPLILCLLRKPYLLSIFKTIYLISDQESEI